MPIGPHLPKEICFMKQKWKGFGIITGSQLMTLCNNAREGKNQREQSKIGEGDHMGQSEAVCKQTLFLFSSPFLENGGE